MLGNNKSERYEGMKDGYVGASDEYGKKILSQAKSFVSQKKYLVNSIRDRDRLIDEYENFTKVLEEKANLTEEQLSILNELGAVIDQLKTIDMLGYYNKIHYHYLNAAEVSYDGKLEYIKALALILVVTLPATDIQKQFISALIQVAGLDVKAFEMLDKLIDNPNVVNINKLVSLAENKQIAYAWIIDAVYLASHYGVGNNNGVKAVFEVTKAMDIYNDEADNIVKHALIISNSDSPEDVFNSVVAIGEKSASWKTILEFRKFSIKAALSSVSDKLVYSSLSSDICDNILTSMSLEIRNISSADSHEFEDAGFISRAITESSRKTFNNKMLSCITEFGKYEMQVSYIRSDINKILKAFRTDIIEYQSSTYDIPLLIDHDCKYKNYDWFDNFMKVNDKLSISVERLLDNLHLITKRIMNLEKTYQLNG